MVGDGSGSQYGRGVGWASVSIDRATRTRRVWCGAANDGTVNLAEFMAYFQPINWLAAVEADRVDAGKPRRARTVHVLTDSTYCATRGSTSAAEAVRNAGLWAALQAYSRLGITVRWHQLGRDQCALNRLADRLSKVARREFARYNLLDAAEQDAGTTVEECNPD